MKAKDIQVGGHYKAKVSGRIVTVRVDHIEDGLRLRTMAGRQETFTKKSYHVTNLSTGRKTTFHSAMKFRAVATTEVLPMTQAVVATQTAEDIIAKATDEAKERVAVVRRDPNYSFAWMGFE